MKRAVLTYLILYACASSLRAQQQHGDALDDALRLVPLTALYTLRVAGVESSATWHQSLAANVTSLVLVYGVTQGLKHVVAEERPDGSDRKSFPSGHAAVAFAGAHSLHREYGHVSPWISVAGYGVATAVAVDRVAKDRHHWHDVAAGAVIGVAASELSGRLSQSLFPGRDVGVSFTGNQFDVIVKL